MTASSISLFYFFINVSMSVRVKTPAQLFDCGGDIIVLYHYQLPEVILYFNHTV